MKCLCDLFSDDLCHVIPLMNAIKPGKSGFTPKHFVPCRLFMSSPISFGPEKVSSQKETDAFRLSLLPVR